MSQTWNLIDCLEFGGFTTHEVKLAPIVDTVSYLKSLYTNRYMIDVLPTPVYPSKTNLTGFNYIFIFIIKFVLWLPVIDILWDNAYVM